jgi:hypothetical protein
VVAWVRFLVVHFFKASGESQPGCLEGRVLALPPVNVITVRR